MRPSTRIGLGAGALIVGLAFAEVPAARAEHENRGFSGTFRGPHGQFSIQIGSPRYPVGSYAPYGHRVYQRPRYGYGFEAPYDYCRSHRVRDSHWVPVRRNERRWVVVERPILIDNRGYGDRYGGGYDSDYDDSRYRDRRYDRGYEDGYRGGYDSDYDDSHYRDRRYDDSRRYEKRRHVHSRSCRHGDDWRD